VAGISLFRGPLVELSAKRLGERERAKAAIGFVAKNHFSPEGSYNAWEHQNCLQRLGNVIGKTSMTCFSETLQWSQRKPMKRWVAPAFL